MELDLSNYATKADLKNANRCWYIKILKNDCKSNLKSNVDKLYLDKLKNEPTNLSSLKSKVDKLDVDKLVPVPVHLSKLSDVIKGDDVKKYVYNAKIKNIMDKILDITNIATNVAPTAVGNEIPNVSNLIKKRTITMTKILYFTCIFINYFRIIISY